MSNELPGLGSYLVKRPSASGVVLSFGRSFQTLGMARAGDPGGANSVSQWLKTSDYHLRARIKERRLWEQHPKASHRDTDAEQSDALRGSLL